MVKNLAVSYQRVSTGEQVGTDRSGLDRQQQAFAQFCERHGLRPAPAALVDAGVSAFRGRNRRTGALAAFIAGAEEGRFPAGTVLVVEDLDRFSREAASRAQGLILRLFDAGVALGIVRDGSVVDRATYDSDIGARLNLLVRQDAAHDYSRKLSSRIEASWEHRRQRSHQGQKVAGYRPFWCDWDGADFQPNEHAATVRRVVALALDGLGTCRIAQVLNAEGLVTSTGRPWKSGTVHKLLTDPRLIGERHWSGGTVVPGYFPEVVNRADFDRIGRLLRARDGRKGSIGRGSAIRNLFQGHAYCQCGRLLTYQSRLSRSKSTRYEYLVCVGKREKQCDRPNVAYDEELILRAVMRTKWRHYFAASDRRHGVLTLRRRIASAEAQVAEHQAQAERATFALQQLVAAGEFSPAAANVIGQQVEVAQAAGIEAQEELQALQAQLAEVEAQPAGRELEKALQAQVEGFIAEGLQHPETRQRFNAWLLSAGITATATDPERNVWEINLDGKRHQAWALRHRGQAETVVEEGLSTVAAVGLAQRGKIDPAAVPGWVQEAADRKAGDFMERVRQRLSQPAAEPSAAPAATQQSQRTARS